MKPELKTFLILLSVVTAMGVLVGCGESDSEEYPLIVQRSNESYYPKTIVDFRLSKFLSEEENGEWGSFEDAPLLTFHHPDKWKTEISCKTGSGTDLKSNYGLLKIIATCKHDELLIKTIQSTK